MARSGGRAAASAVDLFCGVGGTVYGFAKMGLRVMAVIATGEPCRCALEASTGAMSIRRSVEDHAPNDLTSLYRGSVLIGCAPCPPFSSYGGNRSSGMRWFPLDAFARPMRGTSSTVVSMKRVQRLRPHAVFEKFLKCIKGEVYRVRHDAASCSDYGARQSMRRLVLLAPGPGDTGMINRAHRGGLPAVRDAIGDLDPIRAGCAYSKDPPPRSRGLPAADLKHISQTPQGGWRRGWDRRHVLPCRRRPSGRSYDRAHGRMLLDRPAPATTLQATALGSGRFGRPEQDGVLSLREAAPIQAFPRGHEFELGVSGIRIGTGAGHMGNAVPVALGNAIALNVKVDLVGHDGGV